MKTVVILLATALCASTVLADDVALSLSVGEPGFYGHIDIGDVPHPSFVYSEPQLVVQADPRFVPQPVYLRVRPGHERNWKQHCREYGACGQPVYFVQDGWYRDVYSPMYRKQHGKGKGHGKDDQGPKKHKD